MKKSIISIIIFAISIVTPMQASRPVTIGIITDLHYLSPKLMGQGSALDKYIASSGRTVNYTPAVLDQVLAQYVGEHPVDILLVPGDLTKDGEKQSHIELAGKLGELKKRGTRVYVIPGNHDILVPGAVGYDGDTAYRTESVTPGEFESIYADFGYGLAFSRDTASLSYVSRLIPADNEHPEVWLLAIDAARYAENTTSSITAGRIQPQTEQWILGILDTARDRNIQVMGMMHWGLTEHMPYQSSFLPHYLVADWQRLSDLFADRGMKVIFTGHFHTNDITMHTSPAGNTIYDIETGTLSSYPYAYRHCSYYPDRLEVTTGNVMAIPENPNLLDDSKKQLQALTEKMALGMLRKYAVEDTAEVTKHIAATMAKLFILHAFGDEKIDSELKADLDVLSALLGDQPADLEAVEIEYPPADNNVTIYY